MLLKNKELLFRLSSSCSILIEVNLIKRKMKNKRITWEFQLIYFKLQVDVIKKKMKNKRITFSIEFQLIYFN